MNNKGHLEKQGQISHGLISQTSLIFILRGWFALLENLDIYFKTQHDDTDPFLIQVCRHKKNLPTDGKLHLLPSSYTESHNLPITRVILKGSKLGTKC